MDDITIDKQRIDMEDSTDVAYLMTIKDKHGTEITIYIINDKITEWKKS